MKNLRLSTKLTLVVLVVNTICISLLYVIASRGMTSIMKEAEMSNLHAALNAQTNMIEEYIYHQEDMLMAFGRASSVIDFLKEPEDEQKRLAAQEYTETYYARLKNWEGLYIGEWDTHVIAHSNPEAVGMYTREGESLTQLQNEMLSRDGLYNAGIIVSPASEKLVLSLYCPVYDYDGTTVVGYVGGGPFAEELDKLISSIESENARYYMVNVASDMYIFAQDEELMATQIEDDMLLDVIDMIMYDKNTRNGSFEYEDQENGKSVAVYQYIPEYDWAVISCNSEKNIYASVYETMRILAVICIFSDIVIVFLSFLLVRLSTKPLSYVERAIIQLKQLRLDKDSKLDPYINTQSEVGQIATAIDSLYNSIGEMLEAEKEKQVAIAASESRARFLANMSHEIRTPINTVIGMNEMILRENKDEVIHGYAYNIKSASSMLLGLINDILDISKIEAGKFRIVESEYKTEDMLNEAVLAIKARVEEKKLALHVDIDKSLPSVLKGDEIRIKQILNNLLSNAAKYTPKGSITFSAKSLYEEDNFGLLLKVSDTGIGIKKEDSEYLFEGFTRLELEKNRHIEGTGLGLNITKQLVDNMKGRIEVESEYGKGSTFTVYIPQQIINPTTIEQTKKNFADVSEQEPLPAEYLYAPDVRILAVDDNKMNLTVLKALLKRSAIQIDLAMSGTECLEKCRNNKYDLILMDHMMPEPDGIQTLHLLREEASNPNRNTVALVVSANVVEGMEEMYMKEGFAGCLQKPVISDKLEEMLKRFIK